VKTVVVEKGFFLPDDVEMPLSAFQSAEGRGLRVEYTAEQARALPHFDESLYAPIPPERFPALAGIPLGGLLGPTGMGMQPFTTGYPLGLSGLSLAADVEEGIPAEQPKEVQDYLRQQDEANVVISAGDDVLSRDGKKIGEVHSVTVDTQTGRPTTLEVRKGHFFVEDTTLLADAIASIDDGVITLNMDSDQLTG
jgi:sporulation protein YlmC with PRC-barrel domain